MIEPEVAEERHTEIIERVKANITERGGVWGSVDPWGKRKLAYEIDHKADAWYYVLTSTAEPEALDEATRVLAITDGVMRHMAVARPHRAAAAPPAAARARRSRRLIHPTACLSLPNARSQKHAEEEPQMANINRVILTGNLTADPELSTLPSGTSCAACGWP